MCQAISNHYAYSYVTSVLHGSYYTINDHIMVHLQLLTQWGRGKMAASFRDDIFELISSNKIVVF